MKKIIIHAGMFALPLVAAAQNPILNIVQKVGDILNAIVPLIITIALIVFIWGVTQYAIGKGEEAKTEGRDKMIYGAIGLFVIVSIWGIVALLQSFTGVSQITAPPAGIPRAF